jgi:hypothetical protein
MSGVIWAYSYMGCHFILSLINVGIVVFYKTVIIGRKSVELVYSDAN